MNKINYSFSPIDLENYFSSFNKNRSNIYFNLSNENLDRTPNFNHICIKILGQLKQYSSSTTDQNTISTLDFNVKSICKIIWKKVRRSLSKNNLYISKKIEIYNLFLYL